eukprot:scaffold5357_cov208-Amphora_coffeaeformis.AAC.24
MSRWSFLEVIINIDDLQTFATWRFKASLEGFVAPFAFFHHKFSAVLYLLASSIVRLSTMTCSLFATMPSDQLQSLANAATKLNNVGISLMERGYTTEAVRILHEATRALQVERLCSSLSDHLERAYHLLSHVAVISRPSRHIFMDVHIIEDADETTKVDAAMYGPSSSVVFALQLREPFPYASAATVPDSLEYLRAIVMYNFALAHRCHYAATNSILSLVWAETTLRAASALLQQHPFRSAKAVLHRDLLLSMIGYAMERVSEERQRDGSQGTIAATSTVASSLQGQQHLCTTSSLYRTETQA